MSQKVNFLDSYRSIAGLLKERPPQPQKAPEKGDFEKSIAALLPEKAVTNQQSGKSLPGRAEGPQSPMARYRFEAPTPILPTPKRLAADLSEVHGPEKPAHSVNTPTLLSAERRQSAPEPVKPGDPRAHKEVITSAGTRHGVDPLLGMAVAKVESSFDPKAVSSDGHQSKGLFQLLDSTAREMIRRLGVSDSYQPFNAEQNANLGLGYLRYLHDIFARTTELSNQSVTAPAANSSSLEKLALAAFNAGEGRVASAQQRARERGLDPAHYEQVAPYLPESTRKYVERVQSSKASLLSLMERQLA